jgi:hypothetical protein
MHMHVNDNSLAPQSCKWRAEAHLSREREGARGAQKGWGWFGGLPKQVSARKNSTHERTERAARLRRGA